ncbi:hypothetical protein [Hymenobacter daeguensis]
MDFAFGFFLLFGLPTLAVGRCLLPWMNGGTIQKGLKAFILAFIATVTTFYLGNLVACLSTLL